MKVTPPHAFPRVSLRPVHAIALQDSGLIIYRLITGKLYIYNRGQSSSNSERRRSPPLRASCRAQFQTHPSMAEQAQEEIHKCTEIRPAAAGRIAPNRVDACARRRRAPYLE